MEHHAFGNNSISVLTHPQLNRDMRRVAKRALQLSRFDFGFGSTSGVRDKDLQLALHMEGKSLCDGTNKLSKHQPEANASGMCEALDFYAYDENGSPVDATTPKGLFVMTHVALSFMQAGAELGVPMSTGAFFKNYGIYGDLGHVEKA